MSWKDKLKEECKAVFLATVFCVFLVLLLEKGIEGRHEAGGFFSAVGEVFHFESVDRVWLLLISVSGALVIDNFIALIRQRLGKGALLRFLVPPTLSSHSEPHVGADD